VQSISILGNGWLGKPLHKSLESHHLSVKVASRNSCENFEVDIDKLDEDISVFLDSEILIINIPSKNVEGFRALIEKIKLSPITKVLFISSTSVSHQQNTTHPLLLIEDMFRNSLAFKSTVLRFGGLIGGSRNPANFVKNKILLQGVNMRVNLIHLDDCIGIINAILMQELWGETLNACADTHPTKEEFYTYVCQQAGVKTPKFEKTLNEIPAVISNEKLKKLLSYRFIHSDLMDIEFSKNSF